MNSRRRASRAAVIDLPWLNRIDDEWVREALGALQAHRHARQSLPRVRPGRDGRRGAGAHRRARRAHADRPDGHSRLRLQRRRARLSRPRRRVDCAHRDATGTTSAARGTRLRHRESLGDVVSRLRSALDRRRRGRRRSDGAHVREAVSDRRPRDRASGARRRRGRRARVDVGGRRRADAWGRWPVPKRGAILGTRRAAAARARARSSARSSSTKPASRGRTPSPKSPRPPISRCSWKARAAACTARRCRARFRIARCRRCAARSAICAAIMPFNSPLAGVAWKVFPALLCGNAVVVKSHELTPYTAIAFGQLLKDAGLPAGVYSAVQGFGPEVGAPLVQDDRVGVVSFTGSSATGKLIQKSVSERAVLAKVCLELGGKNPFVVCDDADLDAGGGARGGVGVHRCRPALRVGQPHHRVRSRSTTRSARRFSSASPKVKVGSGAEDDCGPVISRASLDRLRRRRCGGAVSRGAALVTRRRRGRRRSRRATTCSRRCSRTCRRATRSRSRSCSGR